MQNAPQKEFYIALIGFCNKITAITVKNIAIIKHFTLFPFWIYFKVIQFVRLYQQLQKNDRKSYTFSGSWLSVQVSPIAHSRQNSYNMQNDLNDVNDAIINSQLASIK